MIVVVRCKRRFICAIILIIDPLDIDGILLAVLFGANIHKMPGKCRFNEQWLLNPQYKSWLQRCEFDNYKALCRLCYKSIEVGAMGEAAIKSHMAGKKHAKLVEGAESGQLFNYPVTSTLHIPALSMGSVASLCCTTSHDPRIAAALPISLSKRKWMSNIPFPDVENALLDWFRIRRSQNSVISGAVLLKKALELAAGYKVPNYKDVINDHWIKLFMEKNGIGVKESSTISQFDNAIELRVKSEIANCSEDDSISDSVFHPEVKLEEIPVDADVIKREVVSPPAPLSPAYIGLHSPEVMEENSVGDEHHSENGDRYNDQVNEPLPMNVPLDFCSQMPDPPRKKLNSSTEMLRMQREQHRLQMVILRQKQRYEQRQHESKMTEHAAAMDVYSLQKAYWMQLLQSVSSGQN